MRILNLGILAHIDAGKTTLTERLLYAAGVISEIGSVDDGSTQTDSLPLERQRGITIKAAVVSFAIGDVTVNLIDTPGHPDFIAEVERVLSVLDGAVLVISAVEGVQAQTRVLMRTLQRLRIPTLIFVNKIDRMGADETRVLRQIAEKLTPSIVPLGTTLDAGSRSAGFAPFATDDRAFLAALAEQLAEHDDMLLADYVADEAAVLYPRLRSELAAQTGRALVHPLFFGSAITGAGVDAISDGIAELLPATEGDEAGPLAGSVFKVERGPAGEKIAYVRMFSGAVHTRDRLDFGRETPAKVTAIRVFEDGTTVQRPSVRAGEIARLWGLDDVRIGDTIGEARRADSHFFAPPTLESVVAPVRTGDKAALHVALTQLAEQDPLINLRQDDTRGEVFVSLYGEVQKEVIQATLANEFGVEVEFRETTPICIERVTGVGAAHEGPPYPFVAEVGVRIEPAPPGSGVDVRLEFPYGYLPLSFHKAVEDGIRESLQQGLYGWRVPDCVVYETHVIKYTDWGSSTPAEHRHLAPLVVLKALERAGTVVCEPIHRFHIEIPADTFQATTSVLARLGALPQKQELRGQTFLLEGEIPAARVHELQQQVPGASRGEGVLECEFDSYRPISGTPPTRRRTDNNPLNRKEYLMQLARRG
ncbi:MAG: translation factor GTPase family protein [Chloroflexota bacterium]